MLAFLWSFVSPWLGPLVVRVAPWLATTFPSLSIRRVIRGVALIGFAAVIAWGTWRIMRRDPDAEPVVAVSVVEAQRYKAENESLRRALAKAEEIRRAREQEAQLAEDYLTALKAEKEALRAQSSDPDAPVFAADDPWLLAR